MIREENLQLEGLQKRMIGRFAQGGANGKSYTGSYIDQSSIQPLWDLYKSSDEHLGDGDAVKEQLAKNIGTLDAFSGTLEGMIG